MRISDILRQKGGDVVTIRPDRSVHEAILNLNQHGIGSLIVTDEGGDVAGIITERDILRQCGERCVALHQPPDEKGCPCLVRDVMTKELVVGIPDDQLDYVMAIMTKNRIRHLPVLEGRSLVGIISIGDVVRAHLDETAFENRMLKDYIHGVAPPAAEG
jgi:CBS domain-containing protein